MPDKMPDKKAASAFATVSAVAALWRDETALQKGGRFGRSLTLPWRSGLAPNFSVFKLNMWNRKT